MNDVEVKNLAEVLAKKLDTVGTVEQNVVAEVHAEIGRRVMNSIFLRKSFGLRKGIDTFSIYGLFDAKDLAEVEACVHNAIIFVLDNNA